MKGRFFTGFTLIETILAIFIFTVLSAGILETLSLGVKTLGRSNVENGAKALAIQKIEFIRNLPYNQIGTVGGIPSGSLAQTETQLMNSVIYTIKTFIQYVDDPADGFGGADTNGITADYKRSRVEVSWPSSTHAAPVVLVSNFSPPGIESINGGGTLKITVLNALGAPVPLARIDLKNNEISPAVDITALTSNAGEIEFPGAPAAWGYEVIASKSGYSQAQTYSASPPNVNPSPGFLTVLDSQTTQAGFAIDTLATLSLHASSTTQSVEGITFRVKGGKTIGLDIDNNPLYKFNQTFQTNGSGDIVIPNIEWDNYTIAVESAGYSIISSQPESPVAVDPGNNTSVLIFVQ